MSLAIAGRHYVNPRLLSLGQPVFASAVVGWVMEYFDFTRSILHLVIGQAPWVDMVPSLALGTFVFILAMLAFLIGRTWTLERILPR